MQRILITIYLILASCLVFPNASLASSHKTVEATLPDVSDFSLPGDNIHSPDLFYGIYNSIISIGKPYNTSDYKNDYGTAAKDICMSFELSRPMKIQFSTMERSSSIPNSNMYLLRYSGGEWLTSATVIDANTKQIASGQDEFQIENLAPGKYYLYVEGRTTDNKVKDGEIFVSIDGTYIPKNGDNKETAIDLGQLSSGGKFADTQNTLNYDQLPTGQIAFGDDYGTSCNDVFYKFTITPEQGPLDVIATHKDRSTGIIDTYIYLLDATGQLIESNDDYYGIMPYVSFMEQSYIKRRLNPGTYYVVSEGNKYNGTIYTIVEGLSPANEAQSIKTDSHIRTISLISDDKHLIEYQYFDGLGKASELVKQQFTPSGKDLAVYNTLDRVNNISTQWLPVPTTSSSGDFVPKSDIKAFAESFYQDARAFTETHLERSSFGRPEVQIAPGELWLDHPVIKTYDFNVANEVKYYYADAAGQLFAPKYYDAGTLHKTVSTDEDGKSVTEYKDKDGRIVMQRSGTNVDTYYAYNDLGQLVYVLPPLAADGLPIRTSGAYTLIWSVLKNYAYIYKYDERGNCIDKKLPGCESIYMVYDKTNRLAMTQDGVQRPDFKWTVYKYDKLGRMLYSSEVTDVRHRTSFEQWLSSFSGWVITEDFDVPAPNNPMDDTGYTRGFFLQPEYYPTRLLSVNYYDDYRFLDLLSPADKAALTYTAKPGYGVQYTVDGAANAKGLVTGTRTYLLDGSGTYTSSVSYYDDKGFVIQSRATNHLGGYDIAYNDLDFEGNPNRTLKEHNIATDGVQQPVVSELYAYTYDQAGRPTKTTYQINSQPAVTLTDLTAPGSYDELGRVASKKRHNGRDTESLTYNVRGWTTKIKSGDFVEDLYYETNPLNQNPCYNGNISYQTWTYGGGGSPKRYAYAYDALNRLTKADYTSNSEYFGYDKMGNLLTLIRGSEKTGSRNIDQLSFGYSGNQVSWITDGAGAYNIYGLKEFTNKYDYNDEFAYDANGNMTKDLNREIVTIKYNLLNLPELVQFKNGNQIKNLYDAAGQKLKSEYYTLRYPVIIPIGAVGNPGNPDDCNVTLWGTHNVGNIEYSFSNDCGDRQFDLGKVYNAEGYVNNIYAGSTYKYNYFRRDHLGTNREVWMLSSSGDELQQVTQYYPSGLPWWEGRMAETQNRKYNGKEFVEAHGYDTYDYGARGYYPAIMRFTTVDPLAEKYYSVSPYAYCAGNPVNRIDLDGRKIIFVNGYLGFGSPSGGATYWNGANSNFVNGAKRFFKDFNSPFFTNYDFNYLTSSTGMRRLQGYQYAKEQYQEIISGMNPKEDSFEFVAHSMGGAFSEGMMEYLKQQGWAVTTAVQLDVWTPGEMNPTDLRPYNPTQVIDATITNDWVQGLSIPLSGNRNIPNSSLNIRKRSKKSWDARHRDFIDSGDELWRVLIPNAINPPSYKRMSWNQLRGVISSWLEQNKNIKFIIE